MLSLSFFAVFFVALLSGVGVAIASEPEADPMRKA
jgi:hypothetical protein